MIWYLINIMNKEEILGLASPEGFEQDALRELEAQLAGLPEGELRIVHDELITTLSPKIVGYTPDPDADFFDALEHGPKSYPKLSADMFPQVEDGAVIAEGVIESRMGGHPQIPGLFSDTCVMKTADGTIYIDQVLFFGHSGKVKLIKKGDKLVVEQA